MRSSSTRVPQVTPGRRQARRPPPGSTRGPSGPCPRGSPPAPGRRRARASSGRTLLENIGRSSPGGPGRAIDQGIPDAPVKPRRGAVGICQQPKAVRREGLLAVGLRELPALEPLLDGLPGLRMELQRLPGRLCHDFTGKIVVVGPRPPVTMTRHASLTAPVALRGTLPHHRVSGGRGAAKAAGR